MDKIKIQIVEDESIFAMDLASQLRDMNYSVVSMTDSGDEAVKEAELKNPDVILMDIKLKGGMDGIDASRKIRKRNNIPIIFLTAYADEHTLKRAKVTEPFGYLLKPINKQELKAVIEMVLYKHHMEKKLIASKERFRKLVENTMDLLFVIDSRANIIDVNQTACQKSGYCRDELLKLSLDDVGIGDEDSVNQILQELVHTPSVIVEDIFRGKRGITFPVEINIGMLSSGETPLLLALVRDITTRKQSEAEKLQLEKQLLRAQKSEELGRLAGGIAHDFNNMLTVILGYSEMALLNIESSSPLYNEIKEIRDAAYRSANLTRQLLLFSRRQSMENTLLNINTIIEDLMHMLDRLLGENVVIKKVLKKGLWDVWGDLGSMEQVIMNLIINAKESIPDKGKIVIRTDNIIVNESTLDDQTEARPGKFIVIEVKDSGMGMDNKTLQKIFTPFFTTKEPEKGTGLGLSVVNNIIKNSQGWIKVNSQLGKGTEFKIFLPACFKEVIEEEEEEKDMKVLRGQGERILLVEDEESVRDFAQLILEKNGYKVTEAATGKQAQLEFRKRDDFQLLFTDMVLPDETGLELAQQIREKNPDIPVLLCSGYVDDRLRRLKDKKEKWEFIQKPYNIVNILQAVKRVLGEE